MILFNKYKKTLLVLSVIILLIALNMCSAVHCGIIAIDTNVAHAANSIVGVNQFFDQLLGNINTRSGDFCVLCFLGIIFVAHSLCGSTFTERVRRLSFWTWAGALCLITYAGVCIIYPLIGRATPVTALSELKNVHELYGINVHSTAHESFPSGHGFAYGFFAMLALFKYPRMGLVLASFGAVMLSTRLIIGIHWLSDIVLGSFLLAALLTFVALETPVARTYFLVRKLLLLLSIKIGLCPIANKATTSKSCKG